MPSEKSPRDACPHAAGGAERFTTPPPSVALTGPVTDLEAEAAEFLSRCHAENPGGGPALADRIAAVHAEIAATGTYTQTYDELSFGARVAWRNASRCIGRLYWNTLQVRDLRQVRSADGIHRELCEHLRLATNDGRIRPMISIFAPDAPGSPGPRVWNDQLVRYAGHRSPDGAVIGDPAYLDFTDLVRQMGWQPSGGPYDLLPLVIEASGRRPELFEVPREIVLEVPLAHPEHPWFADLGLRWYAVPAISNMRLRIGGLDYPLAPFNGWYMGTEIGARNLVDEDRYNLLPDVAQQLGLDTGSESTLWRDRALVEINIAVLHSFRAAGVKITDHHTESRRFLLHLAKEEDRGRIVPADWSWIVPPVSGGITPVFHRYYDEADLSPGFHLDEQARLLGRGACPVPPGVTAADQA
ncbi:nitric oxide synthase oxygenase [Actinoplanes sp. KI2]|uniref:nitric oxide synthase oxygenase n=1 Tax=Actinoplanes sp. KI2 TaxID=2983315 RepID=UPI0021D60398|nr:nitric oxide synthase oxygenase [Actinoplanes sp. KI2]MCU7728895.1 nitric oxide synthase oxygenase [Actinoplanes sp. KI2]